MVFEKLRFRDGLVWTVGQAVEIKLCFSDGLVWTVGLAVEIELRFQISPAQCGRDWVSKILPKSYRKKCYQF